MATVTLKNLASFAGATNLQLFLRKSDGTLINTGGDTGLDEDSIGFFAWTISESIPSEDVFARIYEGETEDAATIVIDDKLYAGQTEIGKEASIMDDAVQELSSPPAANSSLKNKITWIFQWLRNKSTQTATQRKLYADDGTTVVSTEAVSDDGTTYTKGEQS